MRELATCLNVVKRVKFNFFLKIATLFIEKRKKRVEKEKKKIFFIHS